MRTHEVAAQKYWENMFTAVCSRDRLVEFVILNIEEVDFEVDTSKAAARQKFRMVQVELARASDFGQNDRTYITHTHLGEFINFNDTVLCYDLNQMNLQEIEDFEHTHKGMMPDVVIVRKAFPKIRKRQNKRIWKLNRLDMEHADENNVHEKKKEEEGRGSAHWR